MKKNNKKGFTLVELVIVVAVMAVLVAVAIPTIGSITGEAKSAVAKSNARTIESIVKLAEADLDGAEVPAETMAQKIYEAKLGITADANVFTFYYDPATGTVKPADTNNVGWKIEFGKVVVTGGTNAGTYESAVRVTPTGDDGNLVTDATKIKSFPLAAGGGSATFTVYTTSN